MTTTTVTITAAQIKALRSEAVAAGDDKQVRICEAALRKGEDSGEWQECAGVIADGQG